MFVFVLCLFLCLRVPTTPSTLVDGIYLKHYEQILSKRQLDKMMTEIGDDTDEGAETADEVEISTRNRLDFSRERLVDFDTNLFLETIFISS